MRYNLLLVIPILFITGSCRDKLICPAYQSTYILNDSTRMAIFSYAWKLDPSTREAFLNETFMNASDSTDSTGMGSGLTPLDYFAHAENYVAANTEVKRTKYGMQKYEPAWLTQYHLRSTPNQNVLGPKMDIPAVEEEVVVDQGEFIASDFGLDSLSNDSTSVLMSDSTMLASNDSTFTEEPVDSVNQGPEFLYGYDPDDNFNWEEDYYIKYFGKLLVNRNEPTQPTNVLGISAGLPNFAQKEAEPVSSTSDSTTLVGQESLPSIDSAASNDVIPPFEPSETTQPADTTGNDGF
ncbi:MAG: hypothetical protein JXQ90_03285 [Cyclobacteriaceae bacterium]